ncbi:histidine kinase [Leifsonia sp. McL0607]|uniref:sensor histidine kinase n=1 Tax=Leifsonia sp. McL0607 TaxID=3415672 RepID=UPI003CEB815A
MNQSGRPVVPVRRRLPTALADLIVAFVVIGAALLPTGDASDHRAIPSAVFHSPWLLVFPIAATVILLFRRRWPTATLAGTVVLLLAGMITNPTMLLLVVPVVIAAFGVALRATRRTTLVATAATVVVLIVLEMIGRGQILDLRILPLATVVAAAAIAGDATRSRRAYITAITERALHAEETRESEARRRVAEERLRIARDLHDTVAHQITVINLHANVVTNSLRVDPTLAEQSLVTIRTAARAVLTEIGQLLAMLRADIGDEDVPVATLDDLDELIAGYTSSGFTITTRTEGRQVSLPTAVSGVAYRAIQEGLTNAHKHGSEHRAHVLLQYRATQLAITITNRTSAHEPTAAADVPPSGHGLQGIRERVEVVGGHVETGPTGTGYRYQVFIPLATPAAAPHVSETMAS